MSDEVNDYIDTDAYVNDDDYFVTALHGKSTKTDDGSTKFNKKVRRVPIHKITETDEIPEMPVSMDKPNDNHYTKLIKEIDDSITKHQKSIEGVREQIETEKYGANPERKSLLDQRSKLIEVLKPMNEEINVLNKELNPVKNDINWYKTERDNIYKDVPFKDLDRLNNEIK